MKLVKIILTATLLCGAANANDVMQKSMSIMEKGMTQIQQGFLNNNLNLIKDGAKQVAEGNKLFSDKKVIEQFLPDNKKHMANVAANTAERISLDLNSLDLNLNNKAYIDAANSYSDMLNACSRCHSIVRNW